MNLPLRRLLALLALPVVLAGLLSVLVTAFTWPTSHLSPRDLPIAVSGSPAFVAGVTHGLDAADPGGFDVAVAPDLASGEQMLRDNEVDGLFAGEGGEPHLFLASAGRPAVAQLLSQVQMELVSSATPAATAPAVTDVVAAPKGDRRSAVFTAGALPTVLGGIAAGVLIAVSGGSRRRRIARVVLVAGIGGCALTAIMNTWLGALAGHWWLDAGTYALTIAAVTGAITGLENHFGRPGLTAVAAVIMLAGNPLSGATSAPELLPSGWSALGQVLPPGALANGLRAVAFYDGAGAMWPVCVLAVWTLAGLVLIGARPVARLRRRDPAPALGAGM